MTEATGAVRRTIRKPERSDRAKLITDLCTIVTAHTTRAEEAVKALEPCVKTANECIGRTAERRKKGELDPVTSQAELAPPRVVIDLSEALKKMLCKAKSSQDAFTLRCIRTAAITLRAHVDGGLLKEGHYPKDLAMTEQFVRQNFALAAKAHSDVMGALGSTHRDYGISIPEPSLVPVMN